MLSIQKSLDWVAVNIKLDTNVRKVKRNKELNLILKNIGLMVNKLSIEEINCRRLQRQTIKHKELLDGINNEIMQLEQLIMVGILLS
jgi:hypothetical protein